MKVILANPSVPPHVQQTVLAYQQAGYLEYFLTSFLEHPDYKLSAVLKKSRFLEKEIRRRAFDQLDIAKLKTRPFPEFMRSLAARKMGPVITDHIWEWSELGFDHWVARTIRHFPVDIVHTYEHAALATLREAKKRGVFSVYEQPSQHHAFFYAIAKAQIELYPELKSASSELLVNEKAIRRNRRRDEELSLASLILCNSTFTSKTLIDGGANPAKIVVLPLAFPPVTLQIKKRYAKRPMLFLYAGNQSLRKASHILYKAWRLCNFEENEAELLLIGKMLLPESLRSNLPGKVTILENIPHDELMDLYNGADVFVLPTLADGFGMVITEAMSQGVPVIASENCCAPDVILQDKNGWIIPAGDVTRLADQLRWCVTHPGEVARCGEAAKTKAASWQWPEYRQALAEIVFTKWQEFKKK